MSNHDVEEYLMRIKCRLHSILEYRNKLHGFMTVGGVFDTAAFDLVWQSVITRTRLGHSTDYCIHVVRDRERHELVKFVDGRESSRCKYPCNWNDGGDGRKWRLKKIKLPKLRIWYIFGSLKIEADFVCRKTGRTLQKIF